MPYLLDSDWVVDALAGDAAAVDLLERLARDGIAISIVTYMEVYEGVLRSADPKTAEAALNTFLKGIPVLPFSAAVARRCAAIRHALRRAGKRVERRALDLQIAATAVQHSLSLVTRNREDYEDVPGLMMATS